MKAFSPLAWILLFATIVLRMVAASSAADLSPANWPQAEREHVENLESHTVSPLKAEAIESRRGIVSATLSPIAAYAGLQTLKSGGNAADAAATTVLTQTATQLGSVVSYAGVFTVLYYDAKTQRVFSMDAGYNSYLAETDPKSIPASDMGLLRGSPAQKSGNTGAEGRKTLVPGFMAGVEAFHGRFGRLPFRDLFQPAIWYADRGVRISPLLDFFFSSRASFLSRTPEGRLFLRQAGNETPTAGDLFVQPELAKTLIAISENGSKYMYTGQWADDFVRIVQREGGKVTAEDLKRYAPIWSEPFKETVFGHTVYVNGPPHLGASALLLSLNLAESLKLDQHGPYWTDPQAFQSLSRINKLVANAPEVDRHTSRLLRDNGIDFSVDSQRGKAYATAVAPLLEQIFAPPVENLPKHSDAVVVVDEEGNVAAVTHTINAVIWGDTGIIVDGIPIPDSAGFQQTTLASIRPGDRVPHRIIDTIVLDGDHPVLATGSIGSSLVPESIRVLVGMLGQRQDLATMMAAPPLLESFGTSGVTGRQPIAIPAGAYDPGFIAKLKSLGLNLTEMPTEGVASSRGTLAIVVIDPITGKRTAVNQPGVMVFNSGE